MIDAPRDRLAGPRPTCKRPMRWSGNPTRPFCSPACKLMDLGGWLDKVYRVPGAPLSLKLEPAPAPDATRAGA